MGEKKWMDVYVLSGEGDLGTWTKHIARSDRGIRTILTRARCGGDRWARAFLLAPGYNRGTVAEYEREWELRTIPDCVL